jgi:hypothetical protein
MPDSQSLFLLLKIPMAKRKNFSENHQITFKKKSVLSLNVSCEYYG